MTKHDELLREGPRNPPEPETAEQRSRRKRIESGGSRRSRSAAHARFVEGRLMARHDEENQP
jgi:hypothetical protein